MVVLLDQPFGVVVGGEVAEGAVADVVGKRDGVVSGLFNKP